MGAIYRNFRQGSARMTYIRFFNEITLDDVALVGGKGASLGEMYGALVPLGVPVPPGFSVTAPAYRRVIAEADLEGE